MTELEVFAKSLEVSRWTLVVSLVMSTASIVFASLEMAFQRSHNVRSLRPLCEARLVEEEASLAISIRNVGLGPLIVVGLALSSKAGAKPVELREAFVLPPLESRLILSIPASERDTLREARLRICYRDIYDKKHEKLIPLDDDLMPALGLRQARPQA